jgi:hypothetical protein
MASKYYCKLFYFNRRYTCTEFLLEIKNCVKVDKTFRLSISKETIFSLPGIGPDSFS